MKTLVVLEEELIRALLLTVDPESLVPGRQRELVEEALEQLRVSLHILEAARTTARLEEE